MFSGMDLLDIALLIATAIKWLVYTALLWFMIKIQKLNYNVFGLLGSSLAAVLINHIPFVGCYLSYVVLVICLWKCTGADIVPDVVYTVAIAGALMFCFNLWVIGMLMGSIRPDFAHHDGPAPNAMVDDNAAGESEEAEDASDDESEAAPNQARSTGSGQASPVAKPVGVAARTPTVSPKSSVATKSASTAPKGSVPSPAAASMAAAAESGLSVKGASLGSGRASVLISDGTQVYTVGRGESFTVSSSKGRARYRCEEIGGGFVTLRDGNNHSFQLRLP